MLASTVIWDKINSDKINDMEILSKFYFVFSLVSRIEFNKFVKIVKLNILYKTSRLVELLTTETSYYMTY